MPRNQTIRYRHRSAADANKEGPATAATPPAAANAAPAAEPAKERRRLSATSRRQISRSPTDCANAGGKIAALFRTAGRTERGGEVLHHA